MAVVWAATSTTKRWFKTVDSASVHAGAFFMNELQQLCLDQAMNVLVNSLVVGWVLLLIVKAINRSQRLT